MCFENRQQCAGTRRVQQVEHVRSRAGTLTRPEEPICSKNVAADARSCPRLAPLNLHGKEGVDGSSPSEGSAKAPQNEVLCIRADLHFPRSLGCGKRFGKTGPRRIPTRRLMERALEDRAMFDAHSEMGQRRWNALARAPERSSDARKAYAGRVSDADRDR